MKVFSRYTLTSLQREPSLRALFEPHTIEQFMTSRYTANGQALFPAVRRPPLISPVTYTRYESVARRLDTLIHMGSANARMKINEDHYRRLFTIHYHDMTRLVHISFSNTQLICSLLTNNRPIDLISINRSRSQESKPSSKIGLDCLIDLYHEASLPMYQHATIPLSLAGVRPIAPTYFTPRTIKMINDEYTAQLEAEKIADEEDSKAVAMNSAAAERKKSSVKASAKMGKTPKMDKAPIRRKSTKKASTRLTSQHDNTNGRPYPGLACIANETQFRDEWNERTRGLFATNITGSGSGGSSSSDSKNKDKKDNHNKGFNWNNVIVAGGAVLACLLPSPTSFQQEEEDGPYRGEQRPSPYDNKFRSELVHSDIDIFLHGLSHEVFI
jgi:hypothetical protein